MIKYRLIFYFLLICVLTVQAQDRGMNAPKILIEQIRKTLPDTNRIKLQRKLGIYYLFKPGNLKVDKDSAFIYFDQALKLSQDLHSEKWSNEFFQLKGYRYLQTDDIEQGSRFFMQVIRYYHDKNDREAEARTWERFGDGFNRSPSLLENKINSYERARLLYLENKEPFHSIQAFKKLADMHMVEGKYDLAETELLQVVKDLRSIRFADLHYTYDLLASLNRLKGNLHQELFYKLKVIGSMKATGDYSHALYFYNNLAATYYDLGLYENSLIYFNKALPFSLREQNYDGYYEVLRDIVKVLIAQGKTTQALRFLLTKTALVPPSNNKQRDWMEAALGNCYHQLGLNKQAEKHYLKMVKLADLVDKDQYYEDYLKNYSIVSNFYVEIGQYHKANYYLSELRGIPPNLMRPALVSQIHLMQFKVDSAIGNWRSAITHFQLHKKINDSLYNATNKKLLEEVQVRYESEKKDQNLELQSKNIQLLKKQSLLEQNQVDRTRILKNVFVGGTFMLSILLAVSYNRYRLKRRSNLELEDKQMIISEKNTTLEKLLRDNEWLLKEVHHRVKNNLQTVMNLLTAQSFYLKDEVALSAVRDSRHRIQTMSLIHQKLYNTHNVSVINMPVYINELIDYLKDSFKIGKTIYFNVEVCPFSLDVTQAVPVGLILNEAITNAIKYAFPFADNDHITVKVNKLNLDEVLVFVSDNGRGLPENFDSLDQNSFGIKLMKGLVEELGGSFSIISENGTQVSIVFQKMLNLDYMESLTIDA